ncbi:MAG TPA: type II 3-dehydroquinate dehydratase [Acidimicrobiales bacterium]|nr:type II 3-dehydroquinate dehydratase [Acidimicrobiales bacterium]
MTDRRVLLLLSGPNLQLFGERQPEIYGPETLPERVQRATATANRLGFALEHVQSDAEAGLVEAVHGARHRVAGIIVNGGALSHYGWSLHDALAAFDGVIVELHVSNPQGRESWRRRSVLAPVANGVVAGFGGFGYELAVEAAARLLGT